MFSANFQIMNEQSNKTEKQLQLLIQTNNFQQQQQTESVDQQGHVQTAAQRYKTELCRSFQEHGTCKYGEKCQFAHGYQELRSMNRHPKYKSELCRTFHAAGYCPYGPRCHFVHEINSDLQKEKTNRWVDNTINNNTWDNNVSKSAFGSNSSLFSHEFTGWDNMPTRSISSSSSSSTHEISPPSSRSLSPDHNDMNSHDDLDFSTTLLVSQILNNISQEQQFNTIQYLSNAALFSN